MCGNCIYKELCELKQDKYHGICPLQYFGEKEMNRMMKKYGLSIDKLENNSYNNIKKGHEAEDTAK